MSAYEYECMTSEKRRQENTNGNGNSNGNIIICRGERCSPGVLGEWGQLAVAVGRKREAEAGS
jgi:hypothetical protein